MTPGDGGPAARGQSPIGEPRDATQDVPGTAAILTLAGAVAAVGAGLFVLSPLLPDIAETLGQPVESVVRLPALYSLSLAVAAPTVALGLRGIARSALVRWGLLGFGLAWCLPLLGQSAPWLSAMVALAGACAGVVLPSAYALAADLSCEARRARVVGRVVAGWSVAILVVAPLTAGLAQWTSWPGACAGLGAMAIVLSGLLALVMPGARVGTQAVSAPDTGGAMPLARAIVEVARHRPTRRLLLANLLDMGAFYAIYAFLGARLREANGWGASLTGLTLAAYGVGLGIATFNGPRIDRFGALRSARVCLLILAPWLCGLPWLVGWPVAIAAGIALWGVWQGGFFTALTAAATTQIPALRGVITGLLAGSTYLGVALVVPPAGWLYGLGGLPAVGALSGGACLLAWWALRRW